MSRQPDVKKSINVWVEEFDEEDWRELFRSDPRGPFEDDKAFMRVI